MYRVVDLYIYSLMF